MHMGPCWLGPTLRPWAAYLHAWVSNQYSPDAFNCSCCYRLVPLLAVIIGNSARGSSRSFVVRFLSHPALVSVGAYSFVVFLFQHPFKKLFERLDMKWDSETFVLYILVLWISAGVYTEYVEAPFGRWLRRVTELRKP